MALGESRTKDVGDVEQESLQSDVEDACDCGVLQAPHTGLAACLACLYVPGCRSLYDAFPNSCVVLKAFVSSIKCLSVKSTERMGAALFLTLLLEQVAISIYQKAIKSALPCKARPHSRNPTVDRQVTEEASVVCLLRYRYTTIALRIAFG